MLVRVRARLGHNRGVKRPSPVLIYSASRFLLFAACVMVLAVLGARGLLLFVLGFLISGLLSYVLLGGPRNQMAARVAGRASRLQASMDERTRAEDELDDRLRAQQAESPADPPTDSVPD